MSDINNCR